MGTFLIKGSVNSHAGRPYLLRAHQLRIAAAEVETQDTYMANTVQWQDLFVIVDDGSVTIAEYERLEPLVRNQAKAFAAGLGCLVIIPEAASPPPANVRRHLQAMLARLPMRALCYVVEGTGFRAAAVRGVLISLGIFQSTSYATKVVTSLEDALKWMLSAPTPSALRGATWAINEVRAQGARPVPASRELSTRMAK